MLLKWLTKHRVNFYNRTRPYMDTLSMTDYVVAPRSKKSAESDTTRPSRNRLDPNRIDINTRYETGIESGGTRYKSAKLGQLG